MVRLSLESGFELPVQKAGKILLSGGLVACPTESVYAIAADATNEAAVQRVFTLKQRKPDRPILILIPSLQALNRYVADIPPVARPLMNRFWPGGLTLIFEAGPRISPLLTAGTGKIGVRLSSHPVATALAREIQRPITGTSANISDTPPCRDPEEILRVFGEGIDLLLDGGRLQSGSLSTVLDITTEPPQILRQGAIEDPSNELQGMRSPC
ncbi:MAG: threonylcarbamoyl-AMP synthase [Deltaproteobacteria bacterium]|nr:threonylcarbamoyl-AMP synthase [Deltaproteobacteria bacterium]